MLILLLLDVACLFDLGFLLDSIPDVRIHDEPAVFLHLTCHHAALPIFEPPLEPYQKIKNKF